MTPGICSVDPVPISADKAALRVRIRESLAQLTPSQRTEGSAEVCRRVKTLALWRRVKAVMLFVPIQREINIWPLVLEALSSGKRVYLPGYVADENCYVPREIRTPETDLVPGHRGIPEPLNTLPTTPVATLDFLVIPGLAFDSEGRRLGRGKGYYDRLLVQTHGTTCGVGFDQQIVPNVPVEPHDMKLNLVLTPSCSWEPGSASLE